MLSGLTGWWDASDSSTLYDATTGGSLVSSDGAVARFEDKSGAGRHFTQSTLGSRPTRKTSIKNGLDVLRFDGTADNLVTSVTSGNFISSTASTVFVVAVARVVSTDSGSIFANDCALCEQSASHGWFAVKSSGTASVFGWDSNHDISSGSYTASSWAVFSATHGSSTLTGRINGTDFSGLTHGTKAFLSSSLRMGANYNASELFDGDVAEVVMYNVALSASDRNAIESYLRGKWAI